VIKVRYRSSTNVLLIAVVALALIAGCMTRRPAPVVDRSPRVAVTPAPAGPAPTAGRPETYVVKRGDTFRSIALAHGVDPRDLAAWNELTDPTKIQVGQILRVTPPQTAPAPTEPGVVINPIGGAAPIVGRPLGSDGSSGPPLAGAPASPPTPPAVVSGALKTEPKGVRLPYSEENLAALQRERIPGAPKPDMTPQQPAAPVAPPAAKLEAPVAKPEPAESAEERIDWAWPASGKVISTFDGNSSKGVDIAGRLGDPVQASAAGRVVYSGEGIPAYGKLVIIRHSTVYLSAYAHNRAILVKEGQNVVKGQKIAELGATGADQAKLHFEIRRFGKPVDPLQYLPSRP